MGMLKSFLQHSHYQVTGTCYGSVANSRRLSVTRVGAIFTEVSNLLRRIKGDRRWFEANDLGDYGKVVEADIHAKLWGLTAVAAYRAGFWPQVEAKWFLESLRRKHRPDLTLTSDGFIAIVEIDTIDMLGYTADDPHAPKYARNNRHIFRNSPIKSVCLKLLLEQYGEVGAGIQILTLPRNLRVPPPWRAWKRGKIQDARSHFLPKYLEVAKGIGEMYTISITEDKLELYRGDRLITTNEW